jgi:tetratricopeptide (TPR) repeat protein
MFSFLHKTPDVSAQSARRCSVQVEQLESEFHPGAKAMVLSTRVGRIVVSLLAFGTLLVRAEVGLAQAKSGPAYAFAQPPLEFLDRLAKEGGPNLAQLPAAERELLEASWKGRKLGVAASEKALVDALLFASGVNDSQKHANYRDQFDRLAARAAAALPKEKSSYARGEALVPFLHKDIMKNGYALDQTLWHEVFDSGKFNCVSATAMVYAVGARLGLELQPISIPGDSIMPGHATLDLLSDGKRIHVEATNPDGFDWQRKISQPGVIVFGFVPDRKSGYEVDRLGVASMIYSNRAVAVAKSKAENPMVEARLLLAALALDPANSSAAHNVRGLFESWPRQLVEKSKYEEAVRVAEVLVHFEPKNSTLQDNRRIAWSRHVGSLIEAGQDEKAMAVFGQAQKALPDEAEFRDAARAFEVHGEKVRESAGWEAALKIAERGFKALPSAEARSLTAWRSGLFRSWSQSLLDKGDCEESLRVLSRAYRIDPKDPEIAAGVLFHLQESIRLLDRTKDLAAIIKHCEDVRRECPEVKADGAAWNFALSRVVALLDQKKESDAAALAASFLPLVGKERHADLSVEVYGRWGSRLAKEQQWDKAVKVFQEGLARHANNGTLINNALATIDERAQPFMNSNQWDNAIAVYNEGLVLLPGNSHLQNNLRYCQQRKKD